jgi:hypothetical protein
MTYARINIFQYKYNQIDDLLGVFNSFVRILLNLLTETALNDSFTQRCRICRKREKFPRLEKSKQERVNRRNAGSSWVEP